MGFAGNCVPCGLSPQIDGMPVIPSKKVVIAFANYNLFLVNQFYIALFQLFSRKSYHLIPTLYII